MGLPLERMHSWWQVMKIYLAGVMAASLFYGAVVMAASLTYGIVVEPGDLIVGGASGGVFALMTAHFANAILNWQEIKLPASGVSPQRFILIAGYTTYELYRALSTPHEGHIAGAVVGFFTGIVFLRLRTLKSYRTGAKAIWWYSLLILLGLFFAAIE